MAVFKCKMCGGTLNIEENSTVAECEFCGTKQTLPKLSDEKRRNLYDRANHFRRNNDYDKAMSIYEQILNEDKTDAEAYWSIVLCRYGIEYVEDPATHKHVPTVNRTQFTSIFADEDYKSAIANADGYQKDIYEAEAKEIDKIQKGILAISGKEVPFDVFICYKETESNGQRTPDSVLAQDLYFGLKNEGFNVFFSRITLEDKLGTAYEPYIFAALNSAKVMVVLGTKAEHFNAVWVKNEWSRFLALIKNGEKKTIIPAYKDMDPYDLPDEFSHLQAQDMSKLGFMQDLIRGIKKIIGSERSTQVKETVIVSEGHDIAPLLKRAFLFLEDGDFDSANEYCEKVLDMNPECAEAYMAKLLVDLRVKTPEQLSECSTLISENSNYVKAERFANQEYKTLLQKYSQTNAEYVAALNERNRKEAIYSNAIKRISTGNPDGTAFKTSISELQSIIDYKDSKEQVERITQMLERWTKYKTEQAEKERIYAEQERLADERRRQQKRLEEEHQKNKKKKTIITITLLSILMIGIAVLLCVFLLPKNNIPYTVNHYIQNVDNDEYTLQETENLKGTENNTISPAVKDYVGFNAPKTQEVRILEDGSLVVDYYYTRNTYTISLVTNDGGEIQSISKKYQSPFSIDTPQREGYTFGGWFSDVNLTQPAYETMPAENTCIYAWWVEENKPSDFTYYGVDSITLRNYVGTDKALVIPAYIGGVKVEALEELCRNDDNIINVIVPDTVVSISRDCFSGCNNLMSATIGSNVTNFDVLSFSYCVKLIEIINKSNIALESFDNYYGSFVYYRTNIQTGAVTSKLSNEGDFTVYNDNNEKTLVSYNGTESSLIIPNDITHIYRSAFYKNDIITSVEIGEQIKSIGNNAFYGCINLQDFYFDSSNCTDLDGAIFSGAGSNSNGLSIIIGNNVLTIPAHLFSGARINNIQFEQNSSCVTIGDYSFSNCFGLDNLRLPAGITQIGEKAFYSSDIKEIFLPISVEFICASAFSDCPAIIYCESNNKIEGWDDCGSSKSYFGTTGLHGATNDGFEWIQNLDETLRIVKYTGSASTLIVPSNIGNFVVADIDPLVFSNKSTLKNVTININGCIGSRAFENCKNLLSVTIGENVNCMQGSVFAGCGSLTEVKYNAKDCILPSTYDSTIFYRAGINRAGITITFGENVETIPCFLFYSYWESDLPKIKEIVFEDTSTWYRVYHSVSDGSKKDGTEEDVSDSVNNVTLFTESYPNYFWYKL